jgi:hypothetical protein
MLYVWLGTDSKKAHAALASALKKNTAPSVRITDAHAIGDLAAALAAGMSMFGDKRAIVLDGVCANEEMRSLVREALPAMAESADEYFMLEEKVDADTKKKLQKYATSIEMFDAVKKKEYPTLFKLADALKRGDKKNLWVGYQRELAGGNAPEQIHGVLFWGAKQYLLSARGEGDLARGKKLVAALAELPHAARRRGEDLEYALERFILSPHSSTA